MMIQTAKLARWMVSWCAAIAGKPQPAIVTLQLTADDCSFSRRKSTPYGTVAQDLRLNLTDSLQFRLRTGWLWATLEIVDDTSPENAPVVVPLLNKRRAKIWLSVAQLYQFNLQYQLRHLRKNYWKRSERQALEDKRNILFRQAKLSRRFIEADPVLKTLWYSPEQAFAPIRSRPPRHRPAIQKRDGDLTGPVKDGRGASAVV